jgi:hypothetical protein
MSFSLTQTRTDSSKLNSVLPKQGLPESFLTQKNTPEKRTLQVTQKKSTHLLEFKSIKTALPAPKTEVNSRHERSKSSPVSKPTSHYQQQLILENHYPHQFFLATGETPVNSDTESREPSQLFLEIAYLPLSSLNDSAEKRAEDLIIAMEAYARVNSLQPLEPEEDLREWNTVITKLLDIICDVGPRVAAENLIDGAFKIISPACADESRLYTSLSAAFRLVLKTIDVASGYAALSFTMYSSETKLTFFGKLGGIINIIWHPCISIGNVAIAILETAAPSIESTQREAVCKESTVATPSAEPALTKDQGDMWDSGHFGLGEIEGDLIET